MNDDFASKLQAEGERRQGGAMRDLPAACKTDPHGQVGRDASGEEKIAGYAPQRWSKERPAAAGWWWWKYDDSEEPLVLAVRSYKQADHEWYEAQHPYGWMHIWTMTFRFPGGRWAGPLPVPLDASDAESSPSAKLCDLREEASDAR